LNKLAFESLVGNAKVKEILQKTVLEKKFLHSYLFLGQKRNSANFALQKNLQKWLYA